MNTATQNTGIDATINRYQTLLEQKRELERQARQLDKQVKTLETAIGDAIDANGGLIAGEHYLAEFVEAPGRPSYKSICEQFITPAVLIQAVEATPPKRKLSIVRA